MSTTLQRPAATGVIGRGIDRIDGPAKVTGTARYAADAPVVDPLYAVIVQATIPSGRITSIDETAARALPDVVEIVSHRNAPHVVARPFAFTLPFAEELAPLQSDQVHYDGQHVAVVVARTFEAAREGAALLRVAYEPGPVHLTVDDAVAVETPAESFGDDAQPRRGDPEDAYRRSAVKIDAIYETPVEHNNPMEPSATVGEWRDGEIVVHDATQWVRGTRACLAAAFGIDEERVQVIAPFIGGGFGCKGFFWAHPVIAVMASKLTGRPVKLVLTREQMFTSCGYRSLTRQRLQVGASREGKLQAVIHDVLAVSSRVGMFLEFAGVVTPMLFDVPNIAVTHRIARLDVPTPNAMRAPGEAPGSFALGCALDELAVACGLDPLDVLRRNHVEIDPSNGLPFSSKHLLECYERGAAAFGWSGRGRPRTMRDGNDLIGWGVATATYPAMRAPSEARVTIGADGTIDVASATHDLGTGQYTILAQIAAEVLGVEPDAVRVRIGDSSLPNAPVAGGSMSAASVGPAVLDGATKALRALKSRAAASADSPLHGLAEEAIEARDGMLRAISDSTRAMSFAEVVRLAGGAPIEVLGGASPGDEGRRFSFHSFGAHFVEVRVDEDFGRVRVCRAVGAFDCGRILNAKTARSQMFGGIIMGIGMALMEDAVRDPRAGAIVTNNFADYHIPVNADIGEIEILFVEEPDFAFNPLGARGVGEIGITGVAAAIANAVYNATGVRVRELPIVPERLLHAVESG